MRNTSKKMTKKIPEKQRWKKIYQRGAQTAKEFNISTEETVNRILRKP